MSNDGGWNLFDVSSDRKHVVYADGGPDLEIAQINGARPHVLTAGYIGNAELSPNGQLVAFSGGGCGLCVIPAAGGTPHDLGVKASGWAAWSPDSRRLLFAVSDSPGAPTAALAVVRIASIR